MSMTLQPTSKGVATRENETPGGCEGQRRRQMKIPGNPSNNVRAELHGQGTLHHFLIARAMTSMEGL